MDYDFPFEARIWWEWHDGTDPSQSWIARIVGPANFVVLSLDEAEAEYQERRRLAEDSLQVVFTADELWHPQWFPIMSASDVTIAVDCSVEEGAPTPIRAVLWHDVDWATIRAPSLASVIEMWVGFLRDGIWCFVPETAEWDREMDSITVEQRVTFLA